MLTPDMHGRLCDMLGARGVRIECPDCNAAYEVPEAQIRPGRSVRCVRCQGQWRPAGELPEPVAALPPVEDGLDAAAPGHAMVPEQAGVPDQAVVPDQAGREGVRLRQSAAPVSLVPAAAVVDDAASSRLRGRVLTAWGGWAASLVLLGLLLVSAIHWRAAIMQDWPPSIRLYTALGAKPPV